MKKLKRYDEFLIEEIDIKQVLLGGAITAGSLLSNPSFSTEPVKRAPTDTTYSAEKSGDLELFVDTLESENPDIFTNDSPVDGQMIEFGHFERIEYLINKKDEYEQSIGRKIDLNLLSGSNSRIPFAINYFFVRGLDNIDKGPFLIQMLSLDYNAMIKMGRHDIMFNFTRVQNVNTLGVKVNF
jgi:hypothetical protein